MTELLLLENPRRKSKHTRRRVHKRTRRHRARVNPIPKHLKARTRHRAVFYGGPKKLGQRSPLAKLNPKGERIMSHKKHRRRYRRNPGSSLGSATSGIVDGLKESGMGAIAIVAGKFLRNQVNGMLKTKPQNQTVTNVLLAVALPTLTGMVAPNFKKYATFAAAAILADEAKAIPGVGQYLQGYEMLGLAAGPGVETYVELDNKRIAAPVL